MALSDSGYVLRFAGTADAGGEVKGSWARAGSAFPCRVDPVSGGDQVIAERLQERTTHVVTTLIQCDATSTDRFEVVTKGTYDITATPDRTGAVIRRLEVVQATVHSAT